jgi:hypothetical protein
MKLIRHSLAAAVLGLLGTAGQAAPTFVNGLTIDASTLDASGGTLVNDGRLGFFSDIYYDALRNEWWALSDRGPGGGTLDYEVRVHRFTIDVNKHTGEISNFQVRKTFIFRKGAQAFNGLAPAVAGPLGVAFDPEGVVVHPLLGTLVVSDEYGPSVYEFTPWGQYLRAYQIPAGLRPRNAATGVVNYASDAGNDAGKRTNRGFEGLAVSPDGRYVYAMLQSAMLDEGGGSGVYNRIVKFSYLTGRAVAQYAYKMEGSSQGRGISALVALNDQEFLVLERNNRGLGVEAELSPLNKKVYRISLKGATDVSAIDLDAAGAVFTPASKEPPIPPATATPPWLDLAANVGHPSLAALGALTPEKWEGLAIGPKLADGSYLVLAGTDNDYSVTQLPPPAGSSAVQFDRYYKPTAPGAAVPVERIQCDIGTFDNCFLVNADATVGAPVPTGFDFTGYELVPGVLQAYKASAADLNGLKRLELPWLKGRGF